MKYQTDGDVFRYGSKQFTIGGDVFANSLSSYAGLFGTVSEILTEEDSFAEVELMQSILPHLNERERHVLDRRMNGYTAEEIALEMGMSRSNVCKIMKGIREIIEKSH